MTIEWAMWFALGFLVAAVGALVFMASLWRRAVRLTTRRVTAGLPIDADGVRAERDLMAARFARDVRRFELALADLRRRNAEERVALGRAAIDLDTMRSARDAEIARVEAGLAREAEQAAAIAARDAAIGERDEDIVAARATIARLQETITELETTIGSLHNEIHERDVTIATRETQAAAHEVRIEGLAADLAEKKARIEELRKTLGLAETVVAQEKDRADRLDRRIERLVGDVADREEVADRRQRELERARQALTSANARIAALVQRPDGAAGLVGDIGDGEAERRLIEVEDRLAASERERDRLAAIVRDVERSAGDGAPTRAQLRDRIADLAAEMVRLTGAVEGDASAIEAILADTASGDGPRPSLADRIRALRAASAAARGRAT